MMFANFTSRLQNFSGLFNFCNQRWVAVVFCGVESQLTGRGTSKQAAVNDELWCHWHRHCHRQGGLVLQFTGCIFFTSSASVEDGESWFTFWGNQSKETTVQIVENTVLESYLQTSIYYHHYKFTSGIITVNIILLLLCKVVHEWLDYQSRRQTLSGQRINFTDHFCYLSLKIFPRNGTGTRTAMIDKLN